MRVIALEPSHEIYTCRSYLILGEWNQLGDVNTLIDPGTDGAVLAQIEKLSTGCGKVPVSQILLTHNHFDHGGGIGQIKKMYGCRVYAWCDGKDVDELLYDGQFLKAGDDQLQVLHTPGHSSDSICLYNLKQKLLFSGDTQLRVRSSDGVFTQEYVESLRRLAHLDIEIVYSGHDQPVTGGVQEMLNNTLAQVRRSKIF